MEPVMLLQLFVVLGALYVGSRYGSLALGAISGIGLSRDLRWHYASLGRYGLADTDGREVAS